MPARKSLFTATNRGMVLDLIRSRAPISRVELAIETGLTSATMSNVVRRLLADGLVLEMGRGESTGGKPRTMLEINPVARFAVGIQLGADSVTYVVSNLAGAMVGRQRTLGARAVDPDTATGAIAWQVRRLLDSLGVDPVAVVGVGVVAPGPLDLVNGTILAPPTLGNWADFPIRDRLRAATGLPVLLDNDATAAAIGEFWTGALSDSVAHCSIYLGAGLGAGIVLDGTIYRGASSNSGELGQMRLMAGSGRPTVEQLVAPAAVAAKAREALAAGRVAGFALTAESDPFDDFRIIATEAAHGEPFAVELITESAGHLAMAVVSLANLLDLDSITLAGPSFVVAGSLYVEAIVEQLRTDFFARPVHDVRVTLSAHVADAAAVGAAALVLQQELSPRSFGVAPQVDLLPQKR
ncbi:putative NBD/HSP70 family sugar kinase [Nakamurella sp. UYEF19]|uniref:ROK family transcriptional regulator n=1 Tax=Nakamurella sp. UYEF19 TaxID=1756392 RepID=UPI003393D6D8